MEPRGCNRWQRYDLPLVKEGATFLAPQKEASPANPKAHMTKGDARRAKLRLNAARRQAGVMPSSHTLVDAVIWICWGAFAVVWIGGALYNARRSPHVRRRSLRSSVWLLVAITIWLAVRLVIGVDALSYEGEPDALRWLGAALLVVATGLAIWARAELGTMWSSTPVARENHVLRTDGPYAVTRHPIYTGILGMLLGTAVALGFGAWLYVFVLVVVFFELRIRSEEKLMSEAFPGAYDEYRRRVPQLIPGLRLLGSSES
jgi:protein-S-isoprenylcysteine O-methyltransferase Ste14